MDGPAEPSDSVNPKISKETAQFLESDSLAKELGIEIDFAPDELAPPVDRDRLRSFVRKEAAEEIVVEVCHLIGSYRSWYEAWRETLRAEAAQ
jgi:hypothetical protein